MKSNFLILVVAFLLLVSCGGGGYNPPVTPNQNPNSGNNGSNNNQSTQTTSPIARFSYSRSHPFYVHFTNNSTDATSFEWNFGDNTTSSEREPVHQYDGKGVYSVILTAKGNGKTNTYTANIKIEDPTTCYIDKVKYEIVPVNNEYYRIECTDDYWIFKELYWNTDWVLLSSANLPYTYKINKKVDFTLDEYIFRLYKNSSKSGDGKEIGSWTVTPSNIKKYFHEDNRAYNSDMTQVFTIYYRWED